MAEEEFRKRILSIFESQKFPFKQKWDIVVDSPQKLFRAISDLIIENLNCKIVSSFPPELKASPLTETATFLAWIVAGKKMKRRWYHIVGLVHGCLFCTFSIFLILSGLIYDEVGLVVVGGSFLIGGIVGIVLSLRRPALLYVVKLEGESYKAKLGRDKTDVRVSRAGIISDVRVNVGVGMGETNSTLTKVRLKKISEKKVEKEFTDIIERLERLLPSYTLPNVKQSPGGEP